jgi:hypothetical protein
LVFLHDRVQFLSNQATGTGVGGYAVAFGGGAIALYDNSSLLVMSGVTLHQNRSLMLRSQADLQIRTFVQWLAAQ